jgi:hypothetical protein
MDTPWFRNTSGTTSCFRAGLRLTVYEELRGSSRYAFVLVQHGKTQGRSAPIYRSEAAAKGQAEAVAAFVEKELCQLGQEVSSL